MTSLTKLFIKRNPAGGVSSLKPFFGVSLHPPSARLWLFSMGTGARLCLRTSFKHNVTTSVHTHSVFFPAKRTQNSKPGKIFMSTGPDAEEMFLLAPTTPSDRAERCQIDNRCMYLYLRINTYTLVIYTSVCRLK